MSYLSEDPTSLAQHAETAHQAVEGATHAVRTDIQVFLVFIDWLPWVFLGAVLLWLLRSGIGDVRNPKDTRPLRQKLRQYFWDEYWGANATQGQLFLLAVLTPWVYRVQLWWGFITPPELNALIAIAGLVLTSSPPAYEHDVKTERWVKLVLTFGGMINAAAFLGTTLSDIQMLGWGEIEHEGLGPAILQSVAAIIAIVIAALKSSRLSRGSRWRDFMETHPPLSLVHALKRLNQLRRPSLRDDVVELFLALDDEGAAALLASYATHFNTPDSKRVLERAVKETRVFFKHDHGDYPPEHPEDEEGDETGLI